MRRLALRLAAAFCLDCERLVWPWQQRCGSYHTTCGHGGMVRLWRRNLEATNGPAVCWPCSFCGVRPA